MAENLACLCNPGKNRLSITTVDAKQAEELSQCFVQPTGLIALPLMSSDPMCLLHGQNPMPVKLGCAAMPFHIATMLY